MAKAPGRLKPAPQLPADKVQVVSAKVTIRTNWWERGSIFQLKDDPEMRIGFQYRVILKSEVGQAG
jgi:hypothetical protein